MDVSQRFEGLQQEVEENFGEKLVALRRDIHSEPELGFDTEKTAEKVLAALEGLPLDVETGVAQNGIVATLEGDGDGPTVALRADMDALPIQEETGLPFASEVEGKMHACGHDGHTSMLVGAAKTLCGMRERLNGTVKFVFQPAEEGPPQGEQGGAELMVKQGVLANPTADAAFALHIDAKREVNTITYTPRGTYASADDFRILVKGKQTHGGYPWNGVDPIVTAAHIITALQTIVSRQVKLTENPAVVTVGKIQGGVRSNIIPEEVEMVGTIRALHPDDRKLIHERVRRIATNVAESMGATVEVQIPVTTAYPVTFNNEELTAAMVPVLQSVAGADRVRLLRPETGAEDFSFIAERVPSLYIQLGGRPPNVTEDAAADHHTPDFYVDDSGLGLGVRALTAMTLQYMRTRPPASGVVK